MMNYRDIQLIDKDDKNFIAIACDVSGGIGEKPNDLIRVSNEVAGYYAAAVPLIELLSIRGIPMSVVNTLSVEMNPSGKAIIGGIKKALAEIGVDESCLTGSTEDNIQTSMTGIGVTVIGDVEKRAIRDKLPMKGQQVYLVGLPKMGQQLLEEEIEGQYGEIITLEWVKKISKYPQIGHMLPVGSKGIRYEVETLAKTNGLGCMLKSGMDINLEASAGPATCMLVCMYSRDEMFLTMQTKQPIRQIGLLL